MKKAVIYLSKALVHFDAHALQQLQKDASAANAMHGVSGYLYFEGGQFLQYVEGDKAAITQLVKNIGNDKRHQIINLVEDDALQNYRFLSWQMRFLSKDDVKLLSVEKMIINIMQNHLDVENEKDTVADRLWRMTNQLGHNQWRLQG